MTATTKIGRNDPCRCGSGKKYKRCCLSVDEAPAIERARQAAAQAAVFARHSSEIHARLRRRGLRPGEDAMRTVIAEIENEMYELDRLSQLATELTNAGRFDEAAEICDRLVREQPEEVEGLELRARLHEARGELVLATQTYRQALDFTLARDHFDDATRDFYREQVARLEGLAADAAPSTP
jgi:Flp pilus assembly protein TadD